MYRLTAEYLSLIQKHQLNSPINVVALAHDLKIKVYKSQDPRPLSGKIIKDKVLGGESGYAIFVNDRDMLPRQRFTIAHELAHFLLHRDAIGDGIVEDALFRSGLDNEQEVEANRLAADILMPWHLINAEMSKGLKTIEALADKFQVSHSAMSIRLGIPS